MLTGEIPPIGLDDLIALHDSLLVQSWEGRQSDRDFAILGDLRAPSFATIARERFGHAAIDDILSAAESTTLSPWLTCTHDPSFPGLLRKAGGFENRQLATTLDWVASAGNGLVPLLVMAVNRTFATAWAPPGCAVIVDRLPAVVTPEAN